MKREDVKRDLSQEEEQKILDALDSLQEAQNRCAAACRSLCSLEGYGYGRIGKLHDQLKAEWHRLENLRVCAIRETQGVP